MPYLLSLMASLLSKNWFVASGRSGRWQPRGIFFLPGLIVGNPRLHTTSSTVCLASYFLQALIICHYDKNKICGCINWVAICLFRILAIFWKRIPVLVNLRHFQLIFVILLLGTAWWPGASRRKGRPRACGKLRSLFLLKCVAFLRQGYFAEKWIHNNSERIVVLSLKRLACGASGLVTQYPGETRGIVCLYQRCIHCLRRNFPFRKQAMPFLRHLENFSTGRESLSY